jgi:SH3-like domain-containing protein
LNYWSARGYQAGMSLLRSLVACALALVFAAGLGPAHLRAQDHEVPYWATLRYDEVYMRVGPSQEYKIDWVYRREGLPVKVVRVREGWRLIQDHEGTQGWVAATQLNPKLGALIVGEGLADMRSGPSASAALRWRAEPGVVGDLLRCRETFCEIDVAGRSGWVAQDRLWGVGAMDPAS